MAQAQVLQVPSRPEGIKPKVNRQLTDEFVSVKGYNRAQSNILNATVDEVELTVNLETYERMENDPTFTKSKKIIVTNVLTDEMQFAPGANEREVSKKEYENYVEIMAFSKRVISGLEKPYRGTLEQALGNAVRYGHGVGEIEWEFRYDKSDEPNTDNEGEGTNKKVANPAPQGLFASMMEKFGYSSGPQAEDTPIPSETNPQVKKRREEETLRLMPKKIMVKPRGAALFVVDEYMNELGFVPRSANSSWKWNEIIDRRKFMVLTLNKQDEDPRGKSFYRPAFNWYNLKTQMPGEMLRFIIEEVVPKAVGTLPPDAKPYEYELDENGSIVYNDPDTKLDPKTIPTTVSFANQIENFKSGSGAVIPFDAKLEPFRKSANTDAQIFNHLLAVIERQIENALLLQNLAQSEGEHQARSASSTHKELLEAMSFWIRWIIAVMTANDIIKNAIIFNYGPAFVKYMPFISLGDFVRRDWAKDLEVLAKAYFQGFLDDTQRAELMAWLNLPEPGPSRAEVMAQLDPTNGEPVMPNNNRPDKQPGNNRRNDGNGTEKKNNANTGFSPLNFLGHHGKRFVGFTGNIFTGRR